MTHEEITAMARVASSMERLPWNGEWIFRSKKELMAFAALVAAKERDACAQVCDGFDTGRRLTSDFKAAEMAAAIRTRGTKEGA